MTQFYSNEREPLALYQLMIGCIVPRPIAFVATQGTSGVANLAPFSFFTGVGFDPPTVMFSVIDRHGERKDTSRNIEENPEFAVHFVSEAMAEQMNITCGDYGPHVSEFVEAGFTAVPCETISVQRVAESQVTMECRLLQHTRIGRAPNTTSLIIGEVTYWHIADTVLGTRGYIDPDQLLAVGRMGGKEYSRTRDRFAMTRPVIPDNDPRSISTFRQHQAPPMPLPK